MASAAIALEGSQGADTLQTMVARHAGCSVSAVN